MDGQLPTQCKSAPVFFRWDISVICPVIVLKLAVTVFTDVPFRTLWPNRLIRSFQRTFSLWPNKKRPTHTALLTLHCMSNEFGLDVRCRWYQRYLE